MNKQRILKVLGTTCCAMLGLSFIVATSQPAKADWMEWGKQVIEDNFNALRGNTVGRVYDQTFIAELSQEEVKQYKDRWGGDYTAKISDWCNDKAYQAGWRNPIGNQIVFLNTTWREENGKVNCYVRHAAK
ncbi:hypothetical protein CAL7716_048520 [Calothrix sp. PCC 7716]|nr:hypothetical protein CAL7716_048520 [Calothrix sp. PCC 7716]